MHGALFEITDTLCMRYTALTPFVIRATPADEVFQLIRRINERPVTVASTGKAAQQGERRIKVNSKTATGGWY